MIRGKWIVLEIKVLVADDDPYIIKLMVDILKKQGYQSFVAENGEEAIDIFFENSDIDLVILDVMMPIFNGWDVLKVIREDSDVPIIMLTALGDEINEVKGFSHGADDYIGKPFSYKVFVARLEALLRKTKKRQLERITLENLVIDQESRRAYIGEEDCKLNRKEFNLLMYLYINRNRVMTRDQLITQIWGYDFDGNPRTLDTHIKTLRYKLGDYGQLIKTLRGTGYMFEGGSV
ncbi:response regulator transcription factor [Vallitalea okinawensis]|uniref:response regulator transcription factor n=1 Tax=Vallitalea okinawensis TaxID=2078660 RepID=UPI002E8E0CBC|nr:response regulator transcription factor [Vallitalea okinawensis]